MPIETSLPVQIFDQDSFHQIDHQITGIAFDIQNEFGRYLTERLYQKELTRRCRCDGLEVVPEFGISATLDDFGRKYYVDHLINRGVIVETKAASGLTPAHKGQTLNYLFLCGLHHGTLLNFRTERVQHEFVSTRLTASDRKLFEITTPAWKPLSDRCKQMHNLMRTLLHEWGAFLDPILYREALTHFLGGTHLVERGVAVRSGTEIIGTQMMHFLTDDIVFSVTTATHRPESVCEHQQRFLQHTDLRAIQWINLNHRQIEFRTIENTK